MQQPQETPANGHILVSPVWVFVCRILQSLLSLIILALAARLMHDAFLDEEGLALAIAVITWVVVKYAVLTERFSSLHHLYNIIAVLVLDAVMVILWLATFAAVAAKRAKFIFNVTVDGCFDDGSVFNSKTCLTKRDVILFRSGGNMLSAIAGLGALVWLLFIATFAWTLHGFLQGRKQGRFQFDNEPATTQNFPMEPKMEQPYHQPQYQQQQQQPTGQYPQGQYTQAQYPQAQYPQAQYPQQAPSPYPQAQTPYQQQPPYSPPPQGSYPAQDQQATYAQYPPQQQPQQHQQHQQHVQPQAYEGTPPPAAVSPPQQHQPYQAP